MRELIPVEDSPIVVHSGIWPLLGGIDVPREIFAEKILETLLDVVGCQRTILMPAFTAGYADGFIDLDTSPTKLGVINEVFRKIPGVSRTLSAFFSFSVLGPQATEVVSLRPEAIWGDGSLYEWFEKTNTRCLLLGVSRTTFSYLHRLEWLVRDRIPYRYQKTIEGRVRYRGQEFQLKEGLFVRDLTYSVDNSWVEYDDVMTQRGMRSFRVGHGLVSTMTTLEFNEILFPYIKKDPFAFVKNRDAMRALYLNSK